VNFYSHFFALNNIRLIYKYCVHYKVPVKSCVTSRHYRSECKQYPLLQKEGGSFIFPIRLQKQVALDFNFNLQKPVVLHLIYVCDYPRSKAAKN